jgi:hypothetical protein
VARVFIAPADFGFGLTNQTVQKSEVTFEDLLGGLQKHSIIKGNGPRKVERQLVCLL